MYARMVTASVLPGRLDDVIQLWKDSAHGTQEQPGFINARMYADRAGNRIRTVSLWESESDCLASTGWNESILAGFASMFAASPLVETFDLAADVNAALRAQPPHSQTQPE
jgi:hypothetical protein